jgi:hypothetical protein
LATACPAPPPVPPNARISAASHCHADAGSDRRRVRKTRPSYSSWPAGLHGQTVVHARAPRQAEAARGQLTLSRRSPAEQLTAAFQTSRRPPAAAHWRSRATRTSAQAAGRRQSVLSWRVARRRSLRREGEVREGRREGGGTRELGERAKAASQLRHFRRGWTRRWSRFSRHPFHTDAAAPPTQRVCPAFAEDFSDLRFWADWVPL